MIGKRMESKGFVWRLLRACAALLLGLAFATRAGATFHTYRIDQIYSDAGGSVQFVVMHESSGDDGQQFWSGHPFTTTTHTGATLVQYVFPNNLPGTHTANTRVLIASQGFAALGLVTPDYTLPNGFLDPAGGTVNFADVDMVAYAALPADGIHAITRDGTVVQNVATNFAGQSASVGATTLTIGPGFTGAWYDPQQSGHGLFLEVLGPDRLLAWWFTFTPDGTQQSWFGGVGPIAGNTATVPVNLTRGGRWIPNFDATKIVDVPWGTLTFTFSDCNNGRVDFTSTYPGYGSNHMTLTRLTQPAGLTCP